MKNPVEIKGYWHLPDKPEHRIAGILYFQPNEDPRLELLGSLGQDEIPLLAFLNHPDEISVIHGESADAKRVTLLNCRPFGSVNLSASFGLQQFTIQYVLEGIHLSNGQDAVFTGVSVKLPLLTTWINYYNVRFSTGPDGFALNYNRNAIKTIQVLVETDLNLSLDFVATPPSTVHQEMLTVCQAYQLNLETKSPVDFLMLYQKAARFRRFLQLATLSDFGFEGLVLQTSNKNAVNLYYRQYNKLHVQKDIRKFLFTYEKIETEFPELIKKWFAFGKDMAPILKHLVNSIKDKSIFDTADFLIIVQALEGYCWRFRSAWTKKTLQGKLENLDLEFSYVPQIKQQRTDYRLVAESRNYYSHFYQRKPTLPPAEGIPLYHLTQQLKKLLICCILHETGFNNQKTIELFQNIE
jgi:hypothetical protein